MITPKILKRIHISKNELWMFAIAILLILGSNSIIYLQIKAVGEYPETELFSAFIPLLASWLALTSYHSLRDEVPESKQKRIVIYGLLGLIVGLALWVDFVILPIVASAALLLLLFCYRELLSWRGLSLLLGVIVGAFPLILYNLTTPLGSKPADVLKHQMQSASTPYRVYIFDEYLVYQTI
jgi:4-amino-4-deoxy-L-arabinose transferase-like glycosyltransferase